MSRIALVSHNRELNTGRMQPFLDQHEVIDVWAPDAEFPTDVEAIVVMGGFMGAYETEQHPWLEPEVGWLDEMVAADTPVLGICLGAQVLADALGGRSYRAPVPEVGVMDLVLTAEGHRHPVVAALGRRAFFAHQDTFEVPPAATLLARTRAHPAAFCLGSALAIQSHPEVTTADAVAWADHPAFHMFEQVGLSKQDYVDQLSEFSDEVDVAAKAAFEAWFRHLNGTGSGR